jgi:hypothetical protein
MFRLMPKSSITNAVTNNSFKAGYSVEEKKTGR